MPNFQKYFRIIFACFREFLFLKIPSWPLSPSLSNTGTTLLGHKRKIPSSRNCLSLTASLSEIIRQLHICHSNSLANMWMILICSNHSGFSTAHMILFQLLSWPQIFKHLSKKFSALLFMAAYNELLQTWSFKKHKLILSQLWKPKVWNKGVGRAALPQGIEGEFFPCLSFSF